MNAINPIIWIFYLSPFCIFFSGIFLHPFSPLLSASFFCIFFPHFSTFDTFATFRTLTQGRVRGSRGEDPGRLKRMISLNDQGLSKIWYQTFWHTFCACLICSTRTRIWYIIQSLENSKKILINVTESLNYLQILSSIYLPFG